MDLEFQESDIVFADDHQVQLTSGLTDRNLGDILVLVHNNGPGNQIGLKRNGKEVSRVNSSSPMVISRACIVQPVKRPANPIGEEEEEDGFGGMVPPHVIVGRRISEKMASSACARSGRILKGRYLSEVRNSVLRMTGFLES